MTSNILLVLLGFLTSTAFGGMRDPVMTQEITFDESTLLSAGINLSWKVEEASIVFKMKYMATGWVGIGFSKEKDPHSMANSDIVMGWVGMEGADILDAYAVSNGVPKVDKESELELISGKEEAGYTTIVFRRPIVAMRDDDVTIEKGKIGIIWAYGRSDVSGKTLSGANYHARRGHTSLTLIPEDEGASLPSMPGPAGGTSPHDHDHDDHDDTDHDGHDGHDHDHEHEHGHGHHEGMELNHHMYLGSNDEISLRWGIKDKTITFKLKGETLGWMAIGFAPYHNMVNADIIIVGVGRTGSAYAYDCFSTGNSVPGVDKTQDVKILEYEQTDTHTTVKFSRSLDTMDENGQDRLIQNAETYLIWAYGLYDVVDKPGFINYHFTRRGHRKTNFLHELGEPMVVESPKTPEGMGTPEVPEGFMYVSGYKKLDEAGEVVLQWGSAYFTTAVLYLQLSAPTTGWLGLGFSPGHTMAGADLSVAGQKDGVPYVFDMHAIRNTLPIVDKNPNVQLVQVVEDGPRTTILLTRNYKTGDTEHDIDITEGKLNVLWAYGATDVDGTMTRMNYHGRNRGHVELSLISAENRVPESPHSPKISGEHTHTHSTHSHADEDTHSPMSPGSPHTDHSPPSPAGGAGKPESPKSPGSPHSGMSPPSPDTPKKPRPRRRGFQGGSTDVDALFSDSKTHKQAVLDVTRQVKLKWVYNMDVIVFQISIPTRGWLGVGFSPGPNMAGADIFMTGVRKDGVYGVDAFATRNGKPKIDATQNVQVLRYVEKAGTTTVTFARKRDAMDTMDKKIGDSKYVIWAYGRADFAKKPRNFYHGPNRGASMTKIIDGPGHLPESFQMSPLTLVPGKLK